MKNVTINRNCYDMSAV